MESVLSGRDEAAIISAIEDNQIEYWNALLSRTPGALLETQGAIQFGLSGLPHPLFNVVTRTRLEFNDIAARIEQTTRRIRDFGVPFGWVVGPSTRPPDLPRFLQAQGFHVGSRLNGMALELEAVPPTVTAKDVEEVLDLPALDRWMIPCVSAFEMSDETGEWLRFAHAELGFGEGARLRLFLASDRGKPVACSLLYFGAGVAGLYCVGVLAESRRQGYGAAMVQACLNAACEAGCEIAILHASTMGHRFYGRLGFKDYCTLLVYVC